MSNNNASNCRSHLPTVSIPTSLKWNIFTDAHCYQSMLSDKSRNKIIKSGAGSNFSTRESLNWILFTGKSFFGRQKIGNLSSAWTILAAFDCLSTVKCIESWTLKFCSWCLSFNHRSFLEFAYLFESSSVFGHHSDAIYANLIKFMRW